jgi:hypothetical protein
MTEARTRHKTTEDEDGHTKDRTAQPVHQGDGARHLSLVPLWAVKEPALL